MTTLGQDQRAAYERDGFLFPLDGLGKDEARALRTEFEAVEAMAKGDADRERTFRSTANMVVPFIDRLMRDRRITDAVAGILGPDLLSWGCNLFVKEPRTAGFVSWHQDLHYWGLNDNSGEVTAWVALSPSTVESGCVRFVAGSHKQVVAHNDSNDPGNMLSRGQEVAVNVDDADAVCAILAPGQFSLHHGLTVHSSLANSSSDRRIGIAIRYVATSMRNVGETRTDAFLVRGEDHHGNFDLVEPPRGLFDPADIAAAKRSIEKQYVYKLSDPGAR